MKSHKILRTFLIACLVYFLFKSYFYESLNYYDNLFLKGFKFLGIVYFLWNLKKYFDKNKKVKV